MFSPGNLAPLGEVTLTLESNGARAWFTLTCITTGGPATTVHWTRGNDNVTEGTETVLDDRVTAQYTHTLNVTVTSSFSDIYSCTISNRKSSYYASEEIEATVIPNGSGNMYI